MMNAALVVLGVFTLFVFLLLNGPLWLIVRLRFWARGSEAPRRLLLIAKIASRIIAFVNIIFWLTTVSQGNASYVFLIGAILISAAFLLLNGPIWLAARLPFAKGRGSESPLWLQIGSIWFSRLVGAGLLASSFYLAFRLQLLCGNFTSS